MCIPLYQAIEDDTPCIGASESHARDLLNTFPHHNKCIDAGAVSRLLITDSTCETRGVSVRIPNLDPGSMFYLMSQAANRALDRLVFGSHTEVGSTIAYPSLRRIGS